MSPKLVEVGRHINIELVTLADIKDIRGSKGHFKVDIFQKARYVDMSKCVGCGACVEKCPKKVDDVYNADLIKRKSIYVPYAQAVPLKYVIDPEHCLKLTKDKCGNCEKVCPAGAINYQDKDREFTLEVGSVILAPGISPFHPHVGSRRTQKNRLAPMRGLKGYQYLRQRALLVGLLHVCHQTGHHCQGTRPQTFLHHFLYGHENPRQRL